MSKEVAIILASHGDFAQEGLKSLEMIMGTQENMETVSLYPGEDLRTTVEKMEACAKSLDTTEGLLIICDIFGGTPSNAAATVLLKQENEKTAAYAGLNLPILLEIVSSRNDGYESTVQKIEEVASNTWMELKNESRQTESEVDL